MTPLVDLAGVRVESAGLAVPFSPDSGAAIERGALCSRAVRARLDKPAKLRPGHPSMQPAKAALPDRPYRAERFCDRSRKSTLIDGAGDDARDLSGPRRNTAPIR